MSEFLSKGKSFVAQGDRKLLSLGWFSNKYEEAADFFERGANQLKLAKACKLHNAVHTARWELTELFL